MRLIIKFNLLKDCKYEEIGKHDIQGFYLFIIENTKFKNYHSVKGFKFFKTTIEKINRWKWRFNNYI